MALVQVEVGAQCSAHGRQKLMASRCSRPPVADGGQLSMASCLWPPEQRVELDPGTYSYIPTLWITLNKVIIEFIPPVYVEIMIINSVQL